MVATRTIGRRVAVAFVLALGVAACTATSRVEPVAVAPGSEVCLVDNPAVHAGFLPALQSSLASRGYRHRLLAANSAPAGCPVTLLYTARWSWDQPLYVSSAYLSYARLQLFVDGRRVGNALYDASHGAASMGKYSDLEPKIDDLVRQLFPAG